MSLENPIEDVCQHIVSECVMRVMEDTRRTLDSPADSYVLSGTEIQAVKNGDINPILKEVCATSIYHFLRLLEGNFGAFEVQGKQYQYKLILESLDKSESITLIPPEQHEEIENVFLAYMEDWRGSRADDSSL